MKSKRKQRLKRNLNLFSLYFITGKTGFWVPVLYFFLIENKGFDPVLALTLISLTSITTSIFEVPTGVVADKFSRKMSMGIGAFIRMWSIILLIPFNGLVPIAFLMTCRGIGTSFTSGAEDSMLYDSMQELGLKKDYKKQLNRAKMFLFIQAGTTTFLSGLLSHYSLNLPLLFAGISYLLASVITQFFIEPKKTEDLFDETSENYLRHTFNAFKMIASRKGILTGITFLVLGASFIEGVLASNKQIIAPIFDSMKTGAAFVGVATSLIYFSKALGSYLASRFNKEGNELREIYMAFFIFISSALFIALIQDPYFTVAALAVIMGIESLIISNLYKLRLNGRNVLLKRLEIVDSEVYT